MSTDFTIIPLANQQILPYCGARSDVLFFRASSVSPGGWAGPTLPPQPLCCFLKLSRASATNSFVCILCWFSIEVETALKAASRGQEAWCGKRAVLFLSTHHSPRDVIVVIIDCLINQHLLPVNHISCSEAQHRVQLPHSSGDMSSLFASKPFVFYKRAQMHTFFSTLPTCDQTAALSAPYMDFSLY